MQPSSVAAKTFGDRLNLSLLTGTALATISVLGLWAWSGFQDQADDLLADLPEAFEALTGASSGGNYLIAELFGLIAPIVVLVVAIGGGARAVAGEEGDGTASLLFTQPVTRVHVVAAKAGVLVVHVAITTVLFVAGLVLGSQLVTGGIAAGDAVAGGVHLFALGVSFAMVALALSCWTGSTAVTVAVTGALAVAANLVAGLVPLVDGLAGIERFSPWYYYNGSDPISDGIDVAHLGVLATLAVVGFAVAVAVIGRRDLGTGDGGSRLLERIPALDRLTRPRVSGVFAKSLSDRVGVAVIVGGSLAAMAVAVSAMFGGLQETLGDLSDDLPSGLASFVGDADLGTPVGWINAEVLSILAPLALIGLAVVVGSGAVAGEHARRTLGLLLSAPVRRAHVVLANAAVLVAVVAVVVVLLGLGVLAGSVIGDLALDGANIAAAVTHLGLLGVVFGSVALAIGSVASKRTAVATTIGLALAAYLVASVLPLVDGLAGWAAVSPWHYFNSSDPLANGADALHLGVLAVLSLLTVAAAATLVERRDVSG